MIKYKQNDRPVDHIPHLIKCFLKKSSPRNALCQICLLSVLKKRAFKCSKRINFTQYLQLGKDVAI